MHPLEGSFDSQRKICLILGDFKLVIHHAMKSNNEESQKNNVILSCIIMLSQQLDKINYYHILRHLNYEVDKMANDGVHL